MSRRSLLDIGSIVTIVLTLVLFVAALLVKGLTHDLLLEAGVFLVSVKLVITGYKIEVTLAGIRDDIARLRP